MRGPYGCGWTNLRVPSSLPPTGGADWAGASGLSMSGPSRGSAACRPVRRGAVRCGRIGRDGNHLVRADLHPAAGRDAVVVTDAYQSVVGPTGPRHHRRHRDVQPPRRRRRPGKAKGRRRATARRSCRPASRRLRPRRAGRVRGQGRPRDRRPDVPRRRARRGQRPGRRRSSSSSTACTRSTSATSGTC